MNAVRQIYISNVKEFKRDFMEVIWSFVFPAVILIGLGVFTTQSNKMNRYNIGIVDDGITENGKAVTEVMESIENFNITYGNRLEQQTAYEAGDLDAVLLLAGGKTPEGISDEQLHELITCEDEQLYYSIAGVFKTYRSGNTALVSHRAESTDGMDSKVAIVLAITIMQVNIFAVARVIRLKSTGALKAIYTTPLTKKQFLFGEIAYKATITLMQIIFLLFTARLLFHVKIQGNYLLLLLWVLVGCAVFISFGYSLAKFLKKAESANNILQLITFGLIMLSGLFIPVENLPAAARFIVNLSPLNLLIHVMNGAVLGTSPTASYFAQCLGMAAYLLLFFRLSTKFKWESQ